MALTKTYLSFLLISLLSSPTSSQQCYYPSGNKTSTAYQPCSKNSADPLSTICCNPDLGDTCLPNGLCLVSGGYFWRKFCTQEDWTGGKCLDACISDDLFVEMTPCDGTNSSQTWCCGGSTACCGNPALKPITLARAFGVSSSATASRTISTRTTSTRAPAFTTRASDTSSSSSAPENNGGGLSTGAKAGIGVGVPLGLAALVGALLLGIRWYRKRDERAREAEAQNLMHRPNAPIYQGVEMGRGEYR